MQTDMMPGGSGNPQKEAVSFFFIFFYFKGRTSVAARNGDSIR
jgi:hypothetical protein